MVRTRLAVYFLALAYSIGASGRPFLASDPLIMSNFPADWSGLECELMIDDNPDSITRSMAVSEEDGTKSWCFADLAYLRGLVGAHTLKLRHVLWDSKGWFNKSDWSDPFSITIPDHTTLAKPVLLRLEIGSGAANETQAPATP